ncbi:MAG: AAA family ATPase [Phycisphaeraceae bacterium]|nr:AAA family ATPase [Phycisphaeraceae bacterium]
MTTATGTMNSEIESHARTIKSLTDKVGETVVGQEKMVKGLMIGLLSNGHVLLEGVPGLAKTLTVSTLARAIDATYQRIQFTPDLLPADVVGTQIYNPREATFSARKGPVFANIVLADEINRAPAKVQSALLEAMQERHVTIGDTTFHLPDPFLVLATQNPIEQEGTYPLPEAQVDRFMLKLKIDYPSKSQERLILDRMATTQRPAGISPVIHINDLIAARAAADSVHVDAKIRDYIVDIVHATREPTEYGLALSNLIEFGASPRATIALTIASRSHALLSGRGYVTPHDVKSVAMDVLRHRVGVSYEAEAQSITPERIVSQVLEAIAVP